MKKTLPIILLLFACNTTYAQDSLQYYNQRRYQITTTGMKVLGSWAVANVAVGATGWATAHGSAKYFYKMNTFWGGINLGAALLGYSGAQKNKGKQFTAAETIKEQKKIEKIFLINGGLDVAYIATGIYLGHRGDTKNDEKLRGYGTSVILQGSFLLLFDSIMYGTHHNNGSKLRKFLERNPVTFDGQKVGMIIKL